MHIAREIHDELGQLLTVLKMDVSWLNKKIEADNVIVKEKLRKLLSVIDTTVKTVRRIASELRPSLLDDLGLLAAMEWHLEEFERRSGILTELYIAGNRNAITGFFKNRYIQDIPGVADQCCKTFRRKKSDCVPGTRR